MSNLNKISKNSSHNIGEKWIKALVEYYYGKSLPTGWGMSDKSAKEHLTPEEYKEYKNDIQDRCKFLKEKLKL